MSALTGVGPSMAGGNQTCSGTCADLPIAAQKDRSMEMGSSVVFMCKTLDGPSASVLNGLMPEDNWLNSKVPVLAKRIMIPMMKPTSPTRFTIKASMEALAGERRSSAGLGRLLIQKTNSRYELRPRRFQNTKITKKISAKNNIIIEKAKNRREEKKRADAA